MPNRAYTDHSHTTQSAVKGDIMSNAENIEIRPRHEAPNYDTSFVSPIPGVSKKSIVGQKWILLVSFLFMPLFCAAIFAVQGSPEVFERIMNIINSLF